MKKILILIVSFFFIAGTYAQLTLESGANLVVSSGSTVVASGGIEATSATITNNGTIENKGDLVNNTAALFDNSSTGTVKFNGSSAQEITGDADAGFYGTLEIDNSNGVSLTSTSTGSNQTVNGTLTFTNGLLTLNAFDLIIGATDPTGAGSGKYIQTNSTGAVTRNVPADGSTDVLYPVGNSDYNPLILQNTATATADDYSVLVEDDEPTGSVTENMVDRGWVVTEAVADGSELTVTPQWNSGDELTGFDETDCAVGLTEDAGVTYNMKEYNTATGSDPYTREGDVYKSTGTFVVADRDYTPSNTIVADIIIANAEIACSDAINDLTIAGDGTSVEVQTGGEATYIAANKIVFKPGFTAANDSYVHAYITTTNDFCGSLTPAMITNPVNIEEIPDDPFAGFDDDENLVRVYPNPTMGQFTIDFLGQPFPGDIYIMNLQGQPIHQFKTMNQNIIEKDMSYIPDGIYMIVIKSKDKVITKKLAKNK